MSDPKTLMKEAEDCIKTSWMKWDQDYITAGMLFEQAGKLYRAKGEGELAMGAYLKAAKSHLSKGGKGFEAAAKAYEEAARSYPPKSAEMYAKSVELLMSNGSADQAFDAMSKSAETMERAGDVDNALNTYAKASDLISVDEGAPGKTLIRALEVNQTAFKKLVGGKRFPEAIKSGLKLLKINKALNQEYSARKMVLSLTILYLARADVAAAKKLISAELENAEFMRSDEARAAEELVEAWENFDSDDVRKVAEGRTVISLEHQVALLAREIDPLKKLGGQGPPTGAVASRVEKAMPNTTKPQDPKQDASLQSQKAGLFSAPAKQSQPNQTLSPSSAQPAGSRPAQPLAQPVQAAAQIQPSTAVRQPQAAQPARQPEIIQEPEPELKLEDGVDLPDIC